MPTPTQPATVHANTPITIKVLYDGNTRRFKVPLRDLSAETLPQMLHDLLLVPSDVDVIFERYSDSAGCYIQLDSDNVTVYKQLYRAAKAKLKLRIKATTANRPKPPSPESLSLQETTETQMEHGSHDTPAKHTYFDTVLSHPPSEEQQENGPVVASVSPWTIPDDTAKSTVNLPLRSSNADVPSPRRNFSEDKTGLPLISHQSPTGLFCINCNNCGRSIPNEHYHCSICEHGDYDLCVQCVNSGVSCDHWLIKRSVQDGVVTNSITETVAPQNIKAQDVQPVKEVEEESKEPEVKRELPSETSVAAPESPAEYDERICNACLKEFDETKMVTCKDCDDYDLCVTCLLRDTHGHHPAHAFSLIGDPQFCLKSLVTSRCNPGRHYHHAAVCDGCEKRVTGIRHKCLSCPDWDYCSDCISNAPVTHPGHRFVPIYGAIDEPSLYQEVHYGIFCDGPLCKNKTSPGYITGARYKCAVCHDTDFCAQCEAMPTNTHNHSHPLIKFKTPVRGVTVSTLDETNLVGQGIPLGDRVQKSASTRASAPSEPIVMVSDEKAPVKSELVEKTNSALEVVQPETPAVPLAGPSDYRAFFVRDAVADGTTMLPNTVFRKTWTLFNPGPLAWPAGTDVRFVGGDGMFYVDPERPSSLQAVAETMETNKLPAPVEAGQTTDFSVLLRSPSWEGSAISHWRLKLPNGMPFGHRLWCDIRVQSDYAEPEPQEEVPQQEEQAEQVEQLMADEEKSTTGEAEQRESRMIFPTLDKESPEASTHEAAAAPQPASSAPSTANNTELDYLTITETMSTGDRDDSMDGFLTDEEYDVLDASDQEYLEARQSQL